MSKVLELGDVVTLKSESPRMTIIELELTNSTVVLATCMFFAEPEQKFLHITVPTECLVFHY